MARRAGSAPRGRWIRYWASSPALVTDSNEPRAIFAHLDLPIAHPTHIRPDERLELVWGFFWLPPSSKRIHRFTQAPSGFGLWLTPFAAHVTDLRKPRRATFRVARLYLFLASYCTHWLTLRSSNSSSEFFFGFLRLPDAHTDLNKHRRATNAHLGLVYGFLMWAQKIENAIVHVWALSFAICTGLMRAETNYRHICIRSSSLSLVPLR